MTTAAKHALLRPTLIMLYGLPGSGKTCFARQLCQQITAAHVQGDRIRQELFEKPDHTHQENNVVERLMEYMSEEFLRAGVSVVYDTNAMRISQRHNLRTLAERHHAALVLVWLQIDIDSARLRLKKRDRRRSDDKFAAELSDKAFTDCIARMQNPGGEDYVVVSGKHTFNAQRSNVFRRLYDDGLLSAELASTMIIKPGLVNLVPSAVVAGRVDEQRRNINVR